MSASTSSCPTANWNYPTALRFGAGRISELAAACKAQGITRPLLVTDAGLALAPMTRAVLQSLTDAGLGAAMFADIKPNPVAENLQSGLQAWTDGRHDGVVAFGGGSGLDMGKLIAFMSGQKGQVWDYEDVGDNWTRADPDGIAPVIAVPTTAGTGSEVGRAAVITDSRARHVKKIIFHPLMMPKLVICDPQLSVGMPAAITAGTGMDALSHCLEAYCAPGFHPLADGIAVEGMRLVKQALIAVMRNPNDLHARGEMMAAAAMGATAFQKGLGGMHALSHPVGALYDTHHGTTNAMFMPYVLVHNRSAIEARIARLAAYLELPTASFDAFLAWILELRRDLGIPHTLGQLGVDDQRHAEIAEMAEVDPSAGGNPLPFDRAAALRVLQASSVGQMS